MVSPQYLRYATGSEEEKGAGGRLHGGTIAQLFVFCNRGMAGASDSGVRPPMGTGVLSWRAPLIRGGSVLACAVVPPAHPPTFLGTGGLAVPPAGAAPPLHLALGVVASLCWRVWALSFQWTPRKLPSWFPFIGGWTMMPMRVASSPT